MAKVLKYGDTSGIEGDFKQAPVGLYVLRCESIERVMSKSANEPQFEVVFKPVKDANGKKLKENYGQLWYYAPEDIDASWSRRLKELVAAFGLKPKGGNLAVIEGKECLGRLREGTDLNGDYRPNIGKLMQLKVEDEDEDEPEDDDDTGDDDVLDGLDRTQLKKYIKNEGLDITVKKSMDEDDIRALIRELEEDEEPEDEEEPDDEDEDEEDEDEDSDEEEDEEDNYDEMSTAELKKELKERELDFKGKRAVLVARLRTDDKEEPV